MEGWEHHEHRRLNLNLNLNLYLSPSFSSIVTNHLSIKIKRKIKIKNREAGFLPLLHSITLILHCPMIRLLARNQPFPQALAEDCFLEKLVLVLR